MNTAKLATLSLKILKHYIKYYNLPSNHAIEKSDLVTIIFNTRPLTNQNETHYRSLRDKEYKDKIQALERQEQQEQNNGGDFIDNALNSVFNKFTDLFTGDDENNNTHYTSSSSSNSQRQQQQYQQYQQRYQSQNTYRPPPSHSQPSYQPSYNNNNSNYNNNNSSSTRPGNSPRNYQPSPSQQRPPPSSSTTSSYTSSSRQQQQQQQRATAENKSPPTTSTNTLTLNDILKASPPIDLSHLSVRTLKEILKQNHVELNFALEKKELVNRVQQLVDDQMKTNKENQSDIHEEILCRICFDAQQNCVFLNCQHMMACHDCGMKLVETKNECPICREPILQVIRIFRS